MKLLFNQLASYEPLAKVVVVSLDPSFYQLLAVVDGVEHLVWETEEKILSQRNLTAMREKLADLAIGEVVLRQESAYDEMVGQPVRAQSNALEVKLNTSPYPLE
ncbi:MAG: DUF6482 family protein [Porticoccaceae bacterium]|nr:DUF6482 family protein [Porticoccaceae bacterium]